MEHRSLIPAVARKQEADEMKKTASRKCSRRCWIALAALVMLSSLSVAGADSVELVSPSSFLGWYSYTDTITINATAEYVVETLGCSPEVSIEIYGLDCPVPEWC